MNTAYLQQLFDYNYWANRQVWQCIMALSDEQFEQHLDYSIGSIHVQVTHLIAVESWWFKFLATGKIEFDDLNNYPTRASIRQHWDTVEQMVKGYLADITPKELEREVRPPFWREDYEPVKVWEGIMQVSYHSLDHRSQILAGLDILGAPTVAQDFLNFLRVNDK